MEAAGRDGGRELWSYREQSGSISSSAGTISTTAYTSSGSHGLLSLSLISMEAALHLEEMERNDADLVQPAVKKPRKETADEKKMKRINNLFKEFFGAPSWRYSSIEGADMSVLERWFKELGVGWVLHLGDGARAPHQPAGRLGHTVASNWIWALTEIVDTLCLMMSSQFPGRFGSVEQQATESEEREVQFASFTQQAMLKLLAFVDVLVLGASYSNQSYGLAPYQKLQGLLYVRETLSNALCKILLTFGPSRSSELGRILGEIDSVLSAKDDTVIEAIWTQVDKTRNRILELFNEDGKDSSGALAVRWLSVPADEPTRSVMNYVTKFLLADNNYWLVAPIVSRAASLGKYVPRIGDVPPVKSLALEMVSCLQEKLVSKSAEFPDQSFRFLFLLNNSSFIKDQLLDSRYFPQSFKEAVARKVDSYLQNYIQVVCAPVLSCLVNPSTPLCFGKKYYSSPLAKFESEFQKTYNTQKLWQVPDPMLRGTLRNAIIKEIIPDYTNYIEDNKVISPKFTPQKLEEMLQEMFEG